jgi:hypothetical protein
MPGQKRGSLNTESENAPLDELVWMWDQLSAHQQFVALWRLRLRVWPRRARRYAQYWWLEICLRLMPAPRRVWRFVPVSPLIIGDGTIGLA